MAQLEECHAQGFLHRVFGMCNDAKTQLNKCLREERLNRMRQNRLRDAEKKERVRKRWAEIDENS